MGLRSFGGPLAGQDFPDWEAVRERLTMFRASADGEDEPTDDTVLSNDWEWLEVIRWRANGRRRHHDWVGETSAGDRQ